MAAPGLAGRALSGLKWGSASVGAMVVFQLGLMALMARLLTPAAFGLMAMANVAMRLFAFFAQLGIGAALVQRPELRENDIRLALGLTWAICLPATAAVVAMAPLVGWFFRNPEVTLLVQVMAAGFLINGLGAVSLALLRRALRFRAVAFVETLSYVLGYGAVGLACAWAGWGVWALVAATLGQGLLAWLGAYACTRHPMRPAWRGDRSVLLRYGAQHSLVSFVEFLAANLDTAVIGRLLGDAALGLYNRALLLATLPGEKASGVISRVLFPVLSTVQGDRPKVGATWLLGLVVVGMTAGSISLGMAAAAEEVIGLLLGPAWQAAVPVFQVLAVAAPFMFMSHICGVVCDATALLRFKLKLQTFTLLLLAGLMLALYRQGPVGVAWAIVVAEAVRLTVYLRVLGRELHCRGVDVARALGVVLACTTLVCATVSCAALAGRGRWPLPATLAAETVLGAMALVPGLLLALRSLGPTSAGLLARQHLAGVERLYTWARGVRR